MESIRSIGYSFNSAIADIIDNSLAAVPCHNIWIESPPDQLQVSILDDGCGMSQDALKEAMRYGTDPNVERLSNDLGRFGLGLKVASLSQCRQLTVVSKQEDSFCACRWDLDFVKEQNAWLLQVMDFKECEGLPQLDHLMELVSGTLVVWDRLDRLVIRGDAQASLTELLKDSRQFIGLTFHRFMDAEAEDPVRIYLNERLIEPADPFLKYHQAFPHTQTVMNRVPYELDGSTMYISGYVLPPTNKLTAKQRECLGPSIDLNDSQGFYVYRNKRLIIQGTWFRFSGKKELRKNARVQVDIDSSSDALWNIDVKKSMATPPPALNDALKRAMKNVSDSSERLYTFRGRKEAPQGVTPVWNRLSVRDGVVNYSINREHPQVEVFMDSLSKNQRREFELILRSVESNLPVITIYNDKAKDLSVEENKGFTSDEAYDLAVSLIDGGASLECIKKSQPFCYFEEVLNKLVEKYGKD